MKRLFFLGKGVGPGFSFSIVIHPVPYLRRAGGFPFDKKQCKVKQQNTKMRFARARSRKVDPHLGSSINNEVRGPPFSFVKQMVNAFFAESFVNHEVRSSDRDTTK